MARFIGAPSKAPGPRAAGQGEWVCILTALLSSSSATAAFLVSLYIKDIWLGAPRPGTLLTHVQRVCGAAEEVPSADQEAVVVLSKDLAASALDA